MLLEILAVTDPIFDEPIKPFAHYNFFFFALGLPASSFKYECYTLIKPQFNFQLITSLLGTVCINVLAKAGHFLHVLKRPL